MVQQLCAFGYATKGIEYMKLDQTLGVGSQRTWVRKSTYSRRQSAFKLLHVSDSDYLSIHVSSTLYHWYVNFYDS